jgi:GTP cyclohydrolase I
MKMRGVRNDSSITTIAHRGVIEKKEVREQVLALIYNPKSEISRI